MTTSPALQARTVSIKRSRKRLPNSSEISMCIADCKYDAVRDAARARGWKLVDEDPESSARKCHVYWVDVPTIVERTQQLHRWQRINHFPGMSNVARKGRLAQNLDRMRRSFPQEYSFYPRTWVLPAEWGGFKVEFDGSGKSTRTFIIKPDSGCQGRGIFLTQDLDRVAAIESQVAQLYIQKPLLIEGLKFDLRMYVLVTSVTPLRVYVFEDGLARFCTEEYTRAASDNLGDRCMHLTNYAVNKRSNNFVANDDTDRDDIGSKRSLRWLLGWVASERGQDKADALWRKMGNAIVKTLISVLPTLQRDYLLTFGPDKDMRSPKSSHDDKHAAGRQGGAGDNLGSESAVIQDNLAHETADRFPRVKCVGGREAAASAPRGDEASESPQGGRGNSPTHDGVDDTTKECLRAEGKEGLAGGSGLYDERTDGGETSARGGGADIGDGGVQGSRCVEVLGFDFMIDAALKPWLIEVNHLPSFATDSPMDKRIKSQVIATALSVLLARPDDKKRFEENERRDAQNRLYNPDNLATGSLLKEQERKEAEAEAAVAATRKKVSAIYMRFAPHKLSKVDGLLARYAGNEDKLLRLVRRKYVDPVRESGGGGGAAPCDGGGEGQVPSAAPAHGSVAGETAEEAGPPHDLVEPVLDPAERQIAARNEGPEINTRSGSCPPLRTENSQGAPGAPWKKGNKEEPPPVVSSSSAPAPTPMSAPILATEHDTEVLAREAELLKGWERLYPPENLPLGGAMTKTSHGETVGQQNRQKIDPTPPQVPAPTQAADDAGNTDRLGGSSADAGRGGGGVKDSRRRRKSASVESMIQRAFEDDRKMTMRLKCPLQQQRGGSMDLQPMTKLPGMGQAASASDQAQRLTEGYSSGRRRSASAPPGGGQEVQPQLPVSLRIAMVRAKEWRQRREQESARRKSQAAVAVKVHTFEFGGMPGEGNA